MSTPPASAATWPLRLVSETVEPLPEVEAETTQPDQLDRIERLLVENSYQLSEIRQYLDTEVRPLVAAGRDLSEKMANGPFGMLAKMSGG